MSVSDGEHRNTHLSEEGEGGGFREGEGETV